MARAAVSRTDWRTFAWLWVFLLVPVAIIAAVVLVFHSGPGWAWP